MSELEKAFLRAQKKMEGASKDATNPFFKSKYVTYDALVLAVKKPLNDEGLTYRHSSRWSDNIYFVGSYLIHGESNERSETFEMPTRVGNSQETGSALTYSKRYTLGALCGVTTAEDDDGNSASNPPHKPKAPPQPKPETKPDQNIYYTATNEQKRTLMKAALDLGLDDTEELRNISDYCLNTPMADLKAKITAYSTKGKV